jgi:hypothetical protein
MLTDSAWTHDVAPEVFSGAASEYLLRFCEINRNVLIERIAKEGVGLPTPVLIQRICQLLLYKWNCERDYRFLNLLYKFRTNSYMGIFPNDAAGRALRAQLDQTLICELRYE